MKTLEEAFQGEAGGSRAWKRWREPCKETLEGAVHGDAHVKINEQ